MLAMVIAMNAISEQFIILSGTMSLLHKLFFFQIFVSKPITFLCSVVIYLILTYEMHSHTGKCMKRIYKM